MRTTIRQASDPQFDADTITATLANGAEMRIYAYTGHDGVPAIQIDTEGPLSTGVIRVNVNDGAIWEQDPERG